MKYARTKDGKIYELQETKNGEKYLVGNGKLIPLWNTEAYEILAQADAIEKLCDGYYIDDLNEGLNYDGIYNEFDEFKNDFLSLLYEDKANIVGYGFIKTNKGFIFAAKMNDKGDLILRRRKEDESAGKVCKKII